MDNIYVFWSINFLDPLDPLTGNDSACNKFSMSSYSNRVYSWTPHLLRRLC